MVIRVKGASGDLPVCRESEHPFAPPHSQDPHGPAFTPVDDPERRANEFPQKRMAELGNRSSKVRQVGQRLEPTQDVGDGPRAGLGPAPLRVPGRQLLQVAERQLGQDDRDPALVHGVAARSLLPEVRLDFGQGEFSTFLRVGQPFDHRAQEGPLVLRFLVLGQGLNNGDPPARARSGVQVDRTRWSCGR